MESLENGCLLVESVSDLPDLSGADELFLDVETTGLHPFQGDVICGVAVTVDDDPRAWYIPVRHTDGDWNIEERPFQKWLKKIVTTAKEWINHNIVFDAHNCTNEGAEFTGRLPVISVLDQLTQEDLEQILIKTRNALTKQYGKLFAQEGVGLKFDKDAISAIAEKAIELKTGARALRSIMEYIMLDLMYDIPRDGNVSEIIISRGVVEGKKKPIIKRTKKINKKAS